MYKCNRVGGSRHRRRWSVFTSRNLFPSSFFSYSFRFFCRIQQCDNRDDMLWCLIAKGVDFSRITKMLECYRMPHPCNGGALASINSNPFRIDFSRTYHLRNVWLEITVWKMWILNHPCAWAFRPLIIESILILKISHHCSEQVALRPLHDLTRGWTRDLYLAHGVVHNNTTKASILHGCCHSRHLCARGGVSVYSHIWGLCQNCDATRVWVPHC